MQFAAFHPLRGSSLNGPQWMNCLLHIRNHNDHNCFLLCFFVAWHFKYGPSLQPPGQDMCRLKTNSYSILNRWLINQKVSLKCQWELENWQDFRNWKVTNVTYLKAETRTCYLFALAKVWYWLRCWSVVVGGYSNSSLRAYQKPEVSHLPRKYCSVFVIERFSLSKLLSFVYFERNIRPKLSKLFQQWTCVHSDAKATEKPRWVSQTWRPDGSRSYLITWNLLINRFQFV